MREEVDVGEDVLLVGLVALEAELEDVGGDLLVLGKIKIKKIKIYRIINKTIPWCSSTP